MPPAKRPLIIVGYGGHGRVVADIARALDEPPDLFLDDKPTAVGADVVITGPIRSQILTPHRNTPLCGCDWCDRD